VGLLLTGDDELAGELDGLAGVIEPGVAGWVADDACLGVPDAVETREDSDARESDARESDAREDDVQASAITPADATSVACRSRRLLIAPNSKTPPQHGLLHVQFMHRFARRRTLNYPPRSLAASMPVSAG
jgi:hypothetical protein